jgi:hypothetical protein
LQRIDKLSKYRTEARTALDSQRNYFAFTADYVRTQPQHTADVHAIAMRPQAECHRSLQEIGCCCGLTGMVHCRTACFVGVFRPDLLQRVQCIQPRHEQPRSRGLVQRISHPLWENDDLDSWHAALAARFIEDVSDLWKQCDRIRKLELIKVSEIKHCAFQTTQ